MHSVARLAPGILTASAVALLTVACGSGAESNDTESSDEPTGRTFVSTTIEGTPIPGGGPLVLDFEQEGRLAATAGCNRFSGTVDLSDGVLRAPDTASTLMACEPSREGADEWLRELLDAEPGWVLVGDELVLTDDDMTVTLLDEKIVDPDRPLVGTEWTVTALRTPDAVVTSVALEESAPTLVVEDDGTLSGTTGCNDFTGRAEVGADVILMLQPLTVSAAACIDPERSDIERHILDVFTGEVTYSIDGSSMTITAPGGSDGLELTAG